MYAGAAVRPPLAVGGVDAGTLSGQVAVVQGIAECVDVGIGAAAPDGIDGQEAGLRWVIDTGAHDDEIGGGVGDLSGGAEGAQVARARGVGHRLAAGEGDAPRVVHGPAALDDAGVVRAGRVVPVQVRVGPGVPGCL